MKTGRYSRIIAMLLALVSVLALFAGCAAQQAPVQDDVQTETEAEIIIDTVNRSQGSQAGRIDTEHLCHRLSFSRNLLLGQSNGRINAQIRSILVVGRCQVAVEVVKLIGFNLVIADRQNGSMILGMIIKQDAADRNSKHQNHCDRKDPAFGNLLGLLLFLRLRKGVLLHTHFSFTGCAHS